MITHRLYDDSVVPVVPVTEDTTSNEFGIRFKVNRDGWIMGVRFYLTDNPGPHYGKIWDADGNRLAATPRLTPDGIGWQTMFFDLPVRAKAGNTYTASYNNEASFAYTPEGEAPAASRATPVIVPETACYGSPAGAFPGAEIGHNYLVDVIFTTDAPWIPFIRTAYGLLSIAPGLPGADPNDPLAGQLKGESIFVPAGWDFLLYDLHFVGKRVVYGGNDRNSYMHLIDPVHGMVTITDQGDKLHLTAPRIYQGPVEIGWGFGNGGPEEYNVSGLAGGYLVPRDTWRLSTGLLA